MPGDLVYAVNGEKVNFVELVGDDFKGEWDGEKLTVSYSSETPPAKPNAKVTVLISLENRIPSEFPKKIRPRSGRQK